MKLILTDCAKIMNENCEYWTVPWKLYSKVRALSVYSLEEVKFEKSRFLLEMSTFEVDWNNPWWLFQFPDCWSQTCTWFGKCSSRSHFKFVFLEVATPLCKLLWIRHHPTILMLMVYTCLDGCIRNRAIIIIKDWCSLLLLFLEVLHLYRLGTIHINHVKILHMFHINKKQ